LSITEFAQANNQMLLIAAAGASRSVPLFSGATRDVSISPDGRWLLRSTRGAIGEGGGLLVQSLPKEAGGSASSGTWQISVGGYQPLWSADGKEIFYVTANGAMMAVDVESREGFFRAETPHQLFQTQLRLQAGFREYDVSADGKKFLISDPVADLDDVPITIVMNWRKLLRK
jgi:hypothetical protein